MSSKSITRPSPTSSKDLSHGWGGVFVVLLWCVCCSQAHDVASSWLPAHTFYSLTDSRISILLVFISTLLVFTSALLVFISASICQLTSMQLVVFWLGVQIIIALRSLYLNRTSSPLICVWERFHPCGEWARKNASPWVHISGQGSLRAFTTLQDSTFLSKITVNKI